MRAIAALTVLIVHADVLGRTGRAGLGDRLLAHLNVGVTIFFVISGFLLYRPMIAWRGGGPPAPRVRDYLRRRGLRILPAYWAVVTILALVPGMGVLHGGDWWAMYGLVQTLPVHAGIPCSARVFGCALAQTWSLVAEMTFYLALPAAAWALSSASRRLSLRGWAIVNFTVLLCLSAVSIAIEFGSASPPGWFSASAAGYAFWFALGMAMAVGSVLGRPGGRVLRGYPGAWWLAAGVIYLWLALSLPATPFVFSRGDRLSVHLAFGAIAALLLAPAVFGDGRQGFVRRLLGTRAMAWLGLVSYGIFLWHYAFALKLGRAGAGAPFALVLLGTLLAAVACGALSYYLVERPLLRFKYAGAGASGR